MVVVFLYSQTTDRSVCRFGYTIANTLAYTPPGLHYLDPTPHSLSNRREHLAGLQVYGLQLLTEFRHFNFASWKSAETLMIIDVCFNGLHSLRLMPVLEGHERNTTKRYKGKLAVTMLLRNQVDSSGVL